MFGATGQTSPATGGGGAGGVTEDSGPGIARAAPRAGTKTDVCGLAQKRLENISRVFTFDDYIFGGNGQEFYLMKTGDPTKWQYFWSFDLVGNASILYQEGELHHSISPPLNQGLIADTFTDITGSLYFGRDKSCPTSAGNDCSFMTKAYHKGMVVFQNNPVNATPATYGYQTYILTVPIIDNPSFVGNTTNPFVVFKDDSQMPWGLPAAAPITTTTKFFPSGAEYKYLGAAYDPTQQVVFVLTYHDILSNSLIKTFFGWVPWIGKHFSQTLIHFWKLDGKGDAHYQMANAARGYTALVSKSGNLFALELGKWYLLDIFEQKDPIPEKETFSMSEFLNCNATTKPSPFNLDKPILPVKPVPTPSAGAHASNASGNSSETVAPPNPDVTSPAPSESSTAESKKEEKSSPMLIILIIGKDDEKDKEAKPGSPKAGSKVGSKVGSTTGGAKPASTTGAAKSSTGGAGGAGAGGKAGGVKPTKSLAMKSTSSVASSPTFAIGSVSAQTTDQSSVPSVVSTISSGSSSVSSSASLLVNTSTSPSSSSGGKPFDLCNSLDTTVASQITNAFTVGSIMYFGNSTTFYTALMVDPDWKYFASQPIHNLFPDCKNFYFITYKTTQFSDFITGVYFGSAKECNRLQTDCSVMNKAFEKFIIFGTIGSSGGGGQLGYKTYAIDLALTTGSGSKHLKTVSDPKAMPWGLAPNSTLDQTSKFWPQNIDYSFKCFAYDMVVQRLYSITYNPNSVTQTFQLHYRLIDGQFEGNYTAVHTSLNFTSLLYKKGNLFGLSHGNWFLIDPNYSDPKKGRHTRQPHMYDMKTFLNCNKSSPLLSTYDLLNTPPPTTTLATTTPIGTASNTSVVNGGPNAGTPVGNTGSGGTAGTGATVAADGVKSKVGPNEESTNAGKPVSKVTSEASNAKSKSAAKPATKSVAGAKHTPPVNRRQSSTLTVRSMLSLYPSIVLIGLVAINGVILQSSPSSPAPSSAGSSAAPSGVSTTPSGVSASAGQSTVSNSVAPSGVSATTGASAVSPSSQSSAVSTGAGGNSSQPSSGSASTGQSGGSPASQTTGVSPTGGSAAGSSVTPAATVANTTSTGGSKPRDLCNIGHDLVLKYGKRAFIIGDVLYVGDGTRFYRAIITANQWVYFDAEHIHNIFADSNHFTEIIGAVDFGSQQQCTEAQANCAVMTNALDKTLVIGNTSAHVLEYKTYITKDNGVGGKELLPIQPVLDVKDMPWGLPPGGPLTGQFWPQNPGLIYKNLQLMIIKTITNSSKVYIRQIDGQLAGTYTTLISGPSFLAMVYRNGHMFGINTGVGDTFYSLDFSDPLKNGQIVEKKTGSVTEFINCQNTSPLLAPLLLPTTTTAASSGAQTPALATNDTTPSSIIIGGQSTSGDSGTVGSAATSSGTTSSPTKKSSLGSKKTPPKSADKKVDPPTAGSAKTGPKSKVEPSGGAKGKGDKKSDETVRSPTVEPFFICTVGYKCLDNTVWCQSYTTAVGYEYLNGKADDNTLPIQWTNHFTKIINVIDFGSHNLCTQSQANCVIMTNAFDKTLVIGDTSASVRTLVLEYKTYITKDMGVGGHEILPIHPVMDPNVMPWGLPMSGPLTDPFWPQDSGVTFLSMAFDTKQQKLYITEMKSQILRNVYIRQMDGQLAGTYTKLELNTNVDSLLYRNGQIKNSSLVGPSAYPSDGGNSGPQNPSAVTIGGNTSNTTKKPNKPASDPRKHPRNRPTRRLTGRPPGQQRLHRNQRSSPRVGLKERTIRKATKPCDRLNSTPQSSPSSSAPSAINVSTTQSGVSPTQQPSVMSTSTGKPRTTLYPFNGVGYDLCNTGLTVSVKRAFIIGDILYFGDGTPNHFTRILNAIDFGSHNLCTQSQANCAIMANAFDKTLVIGATSAHVLEYKTYITKDMGVGGRELLPIHAVTDAKHMPWGLPMSGPLTDPFWPQDGRVIFDGMAFDTKQQKLDVYIRQMDGQLAGNYNTLKSYETVDSLLYRNGQMYALFSDRIGYRFYLLQFNNSTNRVFYDKPCPILEFINCRKNSSLVGPSAYPSDNSGPQNPSAITINTVGSADTSGTTTSATHQKSSLGSKKIPPKSADKKAEPPTAGSAKTAPKSKVEPSGGAKGEDSKKSDETVRSKMLSLYPSLVLIGLVAINGVTLQSPSQSSPSSAAPSSVSTTQSGVSVSAGQSTSVAPSGVSTTAVTSGVSPSPQAPGVSTTTGQSAASPTSQSSGVSTTTGASAGSPSSQSAVMASIATTISSGGPSSSSDSSVDNGYELCALASKLFLYNAKRAFIIGETLFFGDGTHFYRAIMAGNQWKLVLNYKSLNPYLIANHFTEIISAVSFGSQQECTQSQANCAIMTNAFDKTLVIGNTSANALEYKTYHTKDIGVGGHEILPIHPVMDPNVMPWGLPMSGPLTDPFWPQDKGLIVKSMAYDIAKQSLYITVFDELSVQSGNQSTNMKAYIRQIDGQLAGNYKQMDSTTNYTAMAYRNGQIFAIREKVQGHWYFLDFTDPTKTNLTHVMDFLNCHKSSPLLNKISATTPPISATNPTPSVSNPITTAPNASVSSLPIHPGVTTTTAVPSSTPPGQSSVAITTTTLATNTSVSIGDQSTSGDIGTVGSTHTSRTTTKATPKKSNMTAFWTILIIAIMIVVTVVIICIVYFCLKSKKSEPKPVDNKPLSSTGEPKAEADPSGGAKGGAKDADNKKSGETVRSV
ncbi:unnamed protein product [Medioppia subpectinata]|uniref:Uncharacterized protein n=1 Tax=Medioppia subpectinata TaxID=1979941 RepID=A0A7R9KH99_9ACAR|nr:unnamed protein product [Medioppia subpectinata]CAG2103406.1 unnamed protein product [Medioppia subpectinata]